ncbi:MAG: hypothetical protein ACRDQX_07480 [Pseudonocardiaceae bacterium]
MVPTCKAAATIWRRGLTHTLVIGRSAVGVLRDPNASVADYARCDDTAVYQHAVAFNDAYAELLAHLEIASAKVRTVSLNADDPVDLSAAEPP